MLDLDGTLVDTLGDFVAVLGLTLADLGLPAVSRDFVEHTIGRGGENLVRQTLAHVGAEPTRFDAAWALYQQHYAAVNGAHAAVYPGVREGLEALTRDEIIQKVMDLARSVPGALDQLAPLNLALMKEGSEFNAQVPIGSILRQRPPAGTKVRSGSATTAQFRMCRCHSRSTSRGPISPRSTPAEASSAR